MAVSGDRLQDRIEIPPLGHQDDDRLPAMEGPIYSL